MSQFKIKDVISSAITLLSVVLLCLILVTDPALFG